MKQTLVNPDWLQMHLATTDCRIIDCRWFLGNPGEGRKQYEAGHIPGAIHLDVDTHLSGKSGPGRHPIPNKRDFQKVMSEAGVHRDTHVIIYDAGTGAPAARLWWLLNYFGHEKTSLLDGGWKLWVEQGGAVEQSVPQYPSAEFVARAKPRWVLDKMGVDALRVDADVMIVDARAPERYRGEVEPIDAKAGHIPGAINLPYTSVIDPVTGRFLSPEKLKQKLTETGVQKDQTVICYCGSGITACTNILAMELAGINAKLYEGSWSDWSQDADLPIATKPTST